jgi:hypothetical protein
MSFRDDIKKHADTFWSQPCKDGIVWTSYRDIHIGSEILSRKLSAAEWTGAFLFYTSNGSGRRDEGLFLIKNGERAKALSTWNMESCPSAIMLATFHDKRSDDPLFPPNKPPKDFALNDCTHFTSECVIAGGLPASFSSIDAGQFFDKLHASNKTKSLARLVEIADARRIIDAPRSPFKVGDVIVYSGGPADHHHALVYLGGNQIAMHTVSLHKDHPTRGKGAVWDGLSQDAHHKLVTLYHFDLDDNAATAATWLPGWWRVTQGTDTWHYFFDVSGKVSYTERAPVSTKSPPANPDGKGYWFEDGSLLSLCWTRSATLERFTFKPGTIVTSMSGTLNGQSGLVASKL